MQIIPVIDIRNGVAVRAVAGERQNYAPLVTPVAATSAPLDVARGLASLYAFEAFYVADLDAIEDRGSNVPMIADMAEALAPARLWLDAGFTCANDAAVWRQIATVDLVFGSETLAGAEAAAAAFRDDPRAILSLDFSAAGFLGDPRLHVDDSFWPDRLVVMTLARVGARQGPDVARLRDIVARGARRIFAAGGVRDLDDLLTLKEAGAAGALVATALHEGRLTRADLEALAGC